MNTKTLKDILFAVLSISLGFLFLFSAWSKLPTLEQFGWTVVENTFLNWTMAEWFTRLLIGLEFFLGILFINGFRIRRIAIPVAFITLLVFTAYLFVILYTKGNNNNCGCFGEVVQMSPKESILKNVIMMAVLSVLYFIQYEWKIKRGNWIVVGLFLTVMSLLLCRYPPDSIYLFPKHENLNIPIPLSHLYQSPNNKAPHEELRKGKHVIAFMSLTCPHCRKAAKKMRIMKMKETSLPFYLVLNGDSSRIAEFFNDTKANNIPYTHFNGVEQFIAMAGKDGLPAIKWVEDTTVYKESNYITLDEAEVIEWIHRGATKAQSH